MAPPVRTPRSKWIRAGLEALAAGGPEAVRIEPIAESLGVTKGGFYGHFADRQAFLTALLDSWEHTLVDRVIGVVEASGGDARSRLSHLFTLAATLDTRRDNLFAAELAVREWARREPSVAARLRRVDNRRMDYMRALFGEFTSDPDDIEARCLTAFALFAGVPLITADYGGERSAEIRDLAARRLLS